MKELGNLIGISEQAIGNYERGDREPNIETLTKIANALSTDISNLVVKGMDDATEKLKEAISLVASKISVPSLTKEDLYSMYNESFDDYYIDTLLKNEGEDYFNNLSSEIKQRRIELKIGISKISQCLDVDTDVIENLERDGKYDPALLIRYSLLIDELLELVISLEERLLDVPILSDFTDFNLKDLLELDREQYKYFINTTTNYMKFALEEAKKIDTKKTGTVNPMKGLKSK